KCRNSGWRFGQQRPTLMKTLTSLSPSETMARTITTRMVGSCSILELFRVKPRSLAPIPQPQIDESTLLAMQQHMAQQAAFAQIPDVVKGVSSMECNLGDWQ